MHAAAVLTDTQYALEVQLSAYTLLQILVSVGTGCALDDALVICVCQWHGRSAHLHSSRCRRFSTHHVNASITSQQPEGASMPLRRGSYTPKEGPRFTSLHCFTLLHRSSRPSAACCCLHCCCFVLTYPFLVSLLHQVRNRWGELSPDEQQKITQLAYQHMKDGEPMGGVGREGEERQGGGKVGREGSEAVEGRGEQWPQPQETGAKCMTIMLHPGVSQCATLIRRLWSQSLVLLFPNSSCAPPSLFLVFGWSLFLHL